jgi:hypothetical protein
MIRETRGRGRTNDVFGGENVDLSGENTFFWRQSFKKSLSYLGPTPTKQPGRKCGDLALSLLAPDH